MGSLKPHGAHCQPSLHSGAKLSLAKLERHLYAAADRLPQEGLDAATYKDYIFGMLFLKRCSDVFDAEREKIVGRKVTGHDSGGGGDAVQRKRLFLRWLPRPGAFPLDLSADTPRARPLQARGRHRHAMNSSHHDPRKFFLETVWNSQGWSVSPY